VNGCGIASVVSVQVPGLHLSLKTNWNAGPERGDAIGVSAPFPRRRRRVVFSMPGPAFLHARRESQNSEEEGRASYVLRANEGSAKRPSGRPTTCRHMVDDDPAIGRARGHARKEKGIVLRA